LLLLHLPDGRHPVEALPDRRAASLPGWRLGPVPPASSNGLCQNSPRIQPHWDHRRSLQAHKTLRLKRRSVLKGFTTLNVDLGQRSPPFFMAKGRLYPNSFLAGRCYLSPRCRRRRGPRGMVAATFFGHEDIGGTDIAISSATRMTRQVYKGGTLKPAPPYRRSSGPGDNGFNAAVHCGTEQADRDGRVREGVAELFLQESKRYSGIRVCWAKGYNYYRLPSFPALAI
jgi:hypothetical protein